jgi:hypothetical protein
MHKSIYLASGGVEIPVPTQAIPNTAGKALTAAMLSGHVNSRHGPGPTNIITGHEPVSLDYVMPP